MIMIGAENMETEITRQRDINPLVNPDEPKSVLRPSSILSVGDICYIRLYSFVSIQSGNDLLIELVNIHGNDATECGGQQDRGLERFRKNFRRKNRFKIRRIDFTKVFSPPLLGRGQDGESEHRV